MPAPRARRVSSDVAVGTGLAARRGPQVSAVECRCGCDRCGGRLPEAGSLRHPISRTHRLSRPRSRSSTPGRTPRAERTMAGRHWVARPATAARTMPPSRYGSPAATARTPSSPRPVWAAAALRSTAWTSPRARSCSRVRFRACHASLLSAAGPAPALRRGERARQGRLRCARALGGKAPPSRARRRQLRKGQEYIRRMARALLCEGPASTSPIPPRRSSGGRWARHPAPGGNEVAVLNQVVAYPSGQGHEANTPGKAGETDTGTCTCP